MRFVLLFVLFLLVAPPAFAQGTVVDCGAPVSTDLDTYNVANFCDVYSRQLAYGEEQKHLKEQLEERQKNFYAPRREAHDAYVKNVEALHKSGNNAGNQ